MKNIKRKGFTLVELLIVIVVIGILSAMMMISSTQAVSSAQASQIVANLRAIKVAALAWYADNLTVDLSSDSLNDKKDDIFAYLGNNTNTNAFEGYALAGGAEADWTVTFTGNSLKNKDVQTKLAQLAKSNPELLKSASAVYDSGDTVMMLIRKMTADS